MEAERNAVERRPLQVCQHHRREPVFRRRPERVNDNETTGLLI